MSLRPLLVLHGAPAFRTADMLVCGFTGLSSRVFRRAGDWKVASTRRSESLRDLAPTPR